MKKVLSLFLVVAMLLLSGCSALKENIKDGAEFVRSFCEILTNGDNYKTYELFHPDSEMTMGEFAFYVVNSQIQEGYNFSEGITVGRCTGYSVSYGRKYNGTLYEYTYKMKIGEVDAIGSFSVLENEEGYGIYSFNIEKK